MPALCLRWFSLPLIVLLLNRSHGVISSEPITDTLYIWFIHLFSQLNYLFSESRGCVFRPEFPVAHSRSSLSADWMNWLWCFGLQAHLRWGARLHHDRRRTACVRVGICSFIGADCGDGYRQSQSTLSRSSPWEKVMCW